MKSLSQQLPDCPFERMYGTGVVGTGVEGTGVACAADNFINPEVGAVTSAASASDMVGTERDSAVACESELIEAAVEEVDVVIAGVGGVDGRGGGGGGPLTGTGEAEPRRGGGGFMSSSVPTTVDRAAIAAVADASDGISAAPEVSFSPSFSKPFDGGGGGTAGAPTSAETVNFELFSDFSSSEEDSELLLSCDTPTTEAKQSKVNSKSLRS